MMSSDFWANYVAYITRIQRQEIDRLETFDIPFKSHYLQTVSKTTTYTATVDDDVILCDVSGGDFTVTLPAVANADGKVFIFKKVDSSLNTLTIDGNASETIDDAANQTLSTQYDTIVIVCDGSEWWITARNDI